MAKLMFALAVIYFGIVVGLTQAGIVRINPALGVVHLKSGSATQLPESAEDNLAPVYAHENNTWYCVKNCPAYTGQ